MEESKDLKKDIKDKFGKKNYTAVIDETTNTKELIPTDIVKFEKIAMDCANKILDFYKKAEACTDLDELKEIENKINKLLQGAEKATETVLTELEGIAITENIKTEITNNVISSSEKANFAAKEAQKLITEKFTTYYSSKIKSIYENAKSQLRYLNVKDEKSVNSAIKKFDKALEEIKKLSIIARYEAEKQKTEIAVQAAENAEKVEAEITANIERECVKLEASATLYNNMGEERM